MSFRLNVFERSRLSFLQRHFPTQCRDIPILSFQKHFLRVFCRANLRFRFHSNSWTRLFCREEVFRKFETCREGLTTEVAAVRRTQLGPNILAKDQRVAWTTLIWHSVLNPLVILLAVLAAISFATGDARAGTVMTVMIALGVGLKLVQEAKADSAMASR